MRTAPALAVLLVLPALALAVPTGAAPSSLAKADGPLLDALAGPPGVLAVLVQGPPLADPDVAPADRAAWRAHWAAAAAPFLEAVRARAPALGATVTSEVPAIGAAWLRVPSGRLADLLAMPEVRRAALDAPGMVRLAEEAAGDGGPGVALAMGEALAHLNVSMLWGEGFRGEGVRLAVVDTGVRDTHDTMRRADGSSRVAAWHDATASPCASPCDRNGHGTRTASLAAGGALFNASAPEGAAPRADIVGVRIFVDGGGTWEDAQEGLQAAFDLGADVAASPWGGACTGGGLTTAELAEALAGAGMASVFPGGSGAAIGCPGAAAKVVTTGYTDDREVIASGSARGPCTWQNLSRTCPDVLAVAVNLQAASNGCDTCYGNSTGGSWAAAQVAGVVALLEQAAAAEGGELTPAKADLVLRHSARDLGEPGPDNTYGWGMADAWAARKMLAGGAPGDIRHSIAVSDPEVHAAETATLTLVYANLGSVPVAGRVRHAVEQVDFGPCPPACDRVTYVDAEVELPPLGEFVSQRAFAGADHPPGRYHVDGDADFEWTDPGSGEGRRAAFDLGRLFLVKKVVWAPERGVPALATTGQLLDGGVVLRNVGNEDAREVRFTERFVPRGHLPRPMAQAATPLPQALFAAPPPERVDIRPDLTRADYVWSVGAVPAGAAWEAEYGLVAGQPGSYLFLGTLAHRDETGASFTTRADQVAAVTLPQP